VTWQRAAQLLLDGRAEIVELYDETLRSITREAAKSLEVSKAMLRWFEFGVDASDSAMLVIKMPAVIRLIGVLGRKKVVKFSRINVLTRDQFQCQYCGERKPTAELNYDHVVPRSRGGKTTWTNIVSSCVPCNSRKSNRTPAEAGMRLLKAPVCPKSLPIVAIRPQSLGEVPSLWRDYLYWNVELEP
jgi:5-methylcytosine-specific restriction endonuclease McrA